MLAERKEDYYDYDYDEPLYEEPQEITQVNPHTVRERRGKTSPLDTKLRSRCQMLFVTVAVLAMAVTVRSGISASRGYELVAIQQQVQQVEQENERLRIEISRLKSPQRIGQIASSQLGMEVPNKMYFSHDR